MGVLPVGCDDAVRFVIIDDRFIRWRCTDKNCGDVQEARDLGCHAFHLFDLESGTQWSEYVAPKRRGGLTVVPSRAA